MFTFTLLEHAAPGQPAHWDLLIDDGNERVPTWRLAADPIAAAGQPVPAERIADHRRLYLAYEGEVSGGRGRVRRVDQGAAVVTSWPPPAVRGTLMGKRLCGTFAITGGVLVVG